MRSRALFLRHVSMQNDEKFQIKVRGTQAPLEDEPAGRVLALLARWALRRAQKRHQGVEEEASTVVTGHFSKGSGSQEAAQLTCYGLTKR